MATGFNPKVISSKTTNLIGPLADSFLVYITEGQES